MPWQLQGMAKQQALVLVSAHEDAFFKLGIGLRPFLRLGKALCASGTSPSQGRRLGGGTDALSNKHQRDHRGGPFEASERPDWQDWLG